VTNKKAVQWAAFYVLGWTSYVSWIGSALDQFPDRPKHIVEHFFGEATGIRIVT
jgi:hypothetical protein